MIGFLNKMEMCGTIKSIIPPLQKANSFCTPSLDQYQSNLGKGRDLSGIAGRHLWDSACKKWADVPSAAGFVQFHTQHHPWDDPGTHQAQGALFFLFQKFQNSSQTESPAPNTQHFRVVHSLLNHSNSIPNPVLRHPNPCTHAAGSAPGWGMWNTGSPLLCCTKSKSLQNTA